MSKPIAHLSRRFVCFLGYLSGMAFGGKYMASVNAMDGSTYSLRENWGGKHVNLVRALLPLQR